MCRLGIAAFITEISSGIVIIVFNMLILNISGNIGVAAYGIVVNTAIVVLSVFTGITQGLQPLLSRSYGKGNLKDTHKLLRMGIILSLIISLGVYLIVFLNSKIIVDLFNESKDYSLSIMAEKGIKIYFTGFLFAGMNIVAAAFFAAVEKPKGFADIGFKRNSCYNSVRYNFFTAVFYEWGMAVVFIYGIYNFYCCYNFLSADK